MLPMGDLNSHYVKEFSKAEGGFSSLIGCYALQDFSTIYSKNKCGIIYHTIEGVTNVTDCKC